MDSKDIKQLKAGDKIWQMPNGVSDSPISRGYDLTVLFEKDNDILLEAFEIGYPNKKDRKLFKKKQLESVLYQPELENGQ